MLLLVNGFNLLPLGGLDGAQLFQRVLFSRHRLLEIGFLATASAALALLALHWQSWALGAFAYLGILLLPRGGRLRSRRLLPGEQLRLRLLDRPSVEFFLDEDPEVAHGWLSIEAAGTLAFVPGSAYREAA